MTDIYTQHDKAFAYVSAYVIAYEGERVATVALRYPAPSAERLYAYVHWIGLPMVRGYAGGYGYDKASAAVASAQRNMPAPGTNPGVCPETMPNFGAYEAFFRALPDTDGRYWYDRLRDAGFDVWQAV